MADAERLYGLTAPATSIVDQPGVQKSLTARAYELLQAGCTDIRTVRVGGTQATLALSDSVSANAITLTANYPGAKYDGLHGQVIISPASAAAIQVTTLDGVVHSFPFTSGTTLVGDLVNTINASNINVSASLGSSATITATVTPLVLSSTAFTGGTDGTNMTDAQYSDALTAAYRQLENYGTNVVVPAGAYLQPSYSLDGSGNPTIVNANGGDTVFFGMNLAQFCARVSVHTKSCFGVISIAPLLVPTFLAVNKRASQLTGTTGTAYTFSYQQDYAPSAGPLVGSANGSDGKPFDVGYLLNICAGPDLLVNNIRLGTYVADAAPAYAGRVVSLVPYSATTNKIIPGALGLSYNFGPTVLDAATGARFVVFANQAGAVRTVADQTYSLPANDFTKLSTLRTTYAAVEMVRAATQSFIGEASNPAAYNSMGTACDSALKALKSAGALLDYSYNINATAAEQIDGNVTIDLVLIPALQIRKITATVSLKPAGTN